MKLSLSMLSVVSSLALLAPGLAAHSVPITYTFQGIGAGILGNSTFTDTAVVFSLSGDTSSVTGNGPYATMPVIANFSVVGIGSGQTSNPVSIAFANSGSGQGVLTLSEPSSQNLDLDGFVFGVPSNYALTTSVGPLPFYVAESNTFSTTLGNFTFTAQPTNFTFASAVVPELSSVLGFGSFVALGSIGLLRHKRVRTRRNSEAPGLLKIQGRRI